MMPVVRLSVDGLERCTAGLVYPRSVTAHVSAHLGARPPTRRPSIPPPMQTGETTKENNASPEKDGKAADREETSAWVFLTPNKSETPSPLGTPHSTRDNTSPEGKREDSFLGYATPVRTPTSKSGPQEGTPGSSASGEDGYTPWQLGNIYFFHEPVGEMETFLLYMLGPNYSSNLDVDLSMYQTYDVINEATISFLLARQKHRDQKRKKDKASSSSTSSSSTSSSSSSSASERGRGSLSSETGQTLSILLDPSLCNEQLSSLNDHLLWLFSAKNGIIAQSFRVQGFGSARTSHQYLNLNNTPLTTDTPTATPSSSSGIPTINLASASQSGATLDGIPSPLSSSPPSGVSQLPPSPRKGGTPRKPESKTLAPSMAHKNSLVKRRMRLGVPDLIFNLGGLSNIIWFFAMLLVSHKDDIDALALFSKEDRQEEREKKKERLERENEEGKEKLKETETAKEKDVQTTTTTTTTTSTDASEQSETLEEGGDDEEDESERRREEIEHSQDTIEKQRHAVRLLNVLLMHNSRNVKEMLDISGYELLSRIIRRHNWALDETLLALLFNFVGLQKSMGPSLRAAPNEMLRPHPQLSAYVYEGVTYLLSACQ